MHLYSPENYAKHLTEKIKKLQKELDETNEIIKMNELLRIKRKMEVVKLTKISLV